MTDADLSSYKANIDRVMRASNRRKAQVDELRSRVKELNAQRIVQGEQCAELRTRINELEYSQKHVTQEVMALRLWIKETSGFENPDLRPYYKELDRG